MTPAHALTSTLARCAAGSLRAWRNAGLALRAGRWLAWLVAGVIVLQGLSASFAMGRGPAHVHAAPRATAIVLLDLRRGGWLPAGDETAGDEPTAGGLARFVGHQHGSHHHERAERHFHAADDASVQVSAVEQRIDTATDDAGHALDLVVAALISALACTLLWIGAAAMRHGKASHRGWQPTFGVALRRDRPPQSC